MFNIKTTVDRMVDEIAAEIAAGRIPREVESFSQLHDYVDANEFGGFCEDDLADKMVDFFGGLDSNDGWPDGMVAFINEAQGAVDQIIKSGFFVSRFVKGDAVKILPEYRDEGDDGFTWICCEDEDGGRVRITPIDTGLSIAPQYIISILSLIKG